MPCQVFCRNENWTLSYHDLPSLVNWVMFRNCGNCAKNGRRLSTAPLVGEPSGGELMFLRQTRSFPREPTYETVTELFGLRQVTPAASGTNRGCCDNDTANTPSAGVEKRPGWTTPICGAS